MKTAKRVLANYAKSTLTPLQLSRIKGGSGSGQNQVKKPQTGDKGGGKTK